MPITMKDVRAWLDPEEVNYAGAKEQLGAAALPLLLELAKGGDLGLASKAIYLASLFKSKRAAEVLEAAAARNEPVLSVAVAAGVRNLTAAHAEKVVGVLAKDEDPGVRKVMLKSVARFKSLKIAAKVQPIAKSAPEPFVRELAVETVKSLKRK